MIEQLERRRLMSGDVVVRLEDGWLRVHGDESDNVVIVEQSSVDPSAVLVRGEEGTTLNGSASPLTFGGTADGLRLRIELNGGDDRLGLIGLPAARRARLNMGAGSDETLLRDVSLARAFRFRDMGGRSEATFDSLVVGGAAEVVSGGGADSLAIRHCDFRGTAAIATGAADDYVRIRGTTFEQNTPIDDGQGDDKLDRELIFAWDFRKGAQGWHSNFADYVVFESGPGEDSTNHYRLRNGIEPIPEEAGLHGTGHQMGATTCSCTCGAC